MQLDRTRVLQAGTQKNQLLIEHELFRTKRVVQCAAGTFHALFLTSDGEVYGVGQNHSKQMGLADAMIDTPTLLPFSNIKLIGSGREHSILVNRKNEITICRSSKKTVDYFSKHGLNIVHVDGTYTSSYAVTSDGKCYEIDSTTNELFKQASIARICSGYAHSVFISNDGQLFTQGSSYAEEKDQKIEFFKHMNVKLAACGGSHTAAVVRNMQGYDDVYTFGETDYGRLGRPFDPPHVGGKVPGKVELPGKFEIDSIVSGWNHVIAHTKCNKYFGWGENLQNQLHLGETDNKEVMELSYEATMREMFIDYDQWEFQSMDSDGQHVIIVLQRKDDKYTKKLYDLVRREAYCDIKVVTLI
jgi:alpha-tubulin suppressor-like RCC1 family protein